MTAKVPTSGWVVQVSVSTASPTFQFFNVAISDAAHAVEAARKQAGFPEQAAIRVVRSLSPDEIAAIPLRKGEAKPA